MLRVPLVRVEGKQYAVCPDLTMTPTRFAGAARLERDARDQVARDAERAFDFEPSLYFFAGIAHPSFGDIVLGYHPEFSTAVPGSATTFDTGGMYLGHIKGRGLSTDVDREAYVARDRCDLDTWPARASTWIEDNFETPDAYLRPEGRPTSQDLEGRLGHPQNERRAWTIEVRLYQDRELFEDLAFVVVRQDFLQQALGSAQAFPPDHERLLDLLDDQQLRVAPHPCEDAVSHIQRYVVAAEGMAS